VFSVSIAGFILELVVIYELANKIFLTHRSLVQIFRVAPRWSTAALFLLVTVAGALLPPFDPTFDHDCWFELPVQTSPVHAA